MIPQSVRLIIVLVMFTVNRIKVHSLSRKRYTPRFKPGPKLDFLSLFHKTIVTSSLDSKISQLLRDSVGNVTCRTCMLAHVSSGVPHYNETLQVIQLAARVHRMKRRRTKFSSTSSEDSSTDESGCRFRRPYRGLRMGTLREDILYPPSLSDPDYTSSSEQSADTVIYRGSNGQSLSDRELTDHEGPPRHVPRTNPRLPRRPSGSRSSGEDSDSGRSRTSDGRYAPRPAMGTRVGNVVSVAGVVPRVQPPPLPHVISAPGSPTHLKLAQRMAVHAKLTAGVKPGESGAGVGQWPEKLSKPRGKGLTAASEQWVDGPGAAIYPDNGPRVEQWVDRPGVAIYPDSGGRGEQWVDRPGVVKYPDNGSRGEQWVDGPPAFLLQSSDHHPQPPPPPQQQQQQQTVPPSHSHSPSPRGAGDAGRRGKRGKVEAEELWVDGPREMMAASAPHTPAPLHTSTTTTTTTKGDPPGRAVVGQPNQGPKLSTAVSDKALKQALIKHLEKERPETSQALDTHVCAEAAPASTPAPGGLGGVDRLREGSKLRDCCQQHPYQWELRQSGDGVSVVGMEVGGAWVAEEKEGGEKGQEYSPSSSLPRKLHKDHHHHLSKRLVTTSKHSSPKPSPASSRKISQEGEGRGPVAAAGSLHKSALSGSASPTHRVAQWIKAVTKADVIPTDVTTYVTTSGVPTATDVVMADAETNTEHDSDFERMADYDEVEVTVPQESTLGVCGLPGDAGVDGSADATQGSGARQEAAHEHRAEGQPDNTPSSPTDRTVPATQATSEALSCQSARDTANSAQREGTDPGKDLVALRLNPKLARHRDRYEASPTRAHHERSPTRSQKEASPARVQHEACPARASMGLVTLLPDLSKPLLLRKPDGASNPHLNKECAEEGECVGVNDPCVAVLGSHTDFYSTAQVAYVMDGTITEVADKAASHRKPSLPHKAPSPSPSPCPKTNGLTKITAVSSCCSSSSSPSLPPPPASVPSPSPKPVSSKDLQKQGSSPRGSLLCNGRKAKSGKDKTSASPCSLSPALSSKSSKKSSSGVSRLPLFTSSAKSSVPASPASSSPSSKDGKLRKKEKDSAKAGVRSTCVIPLQQQHKGRLGHADPDPGKDGGVGGGGVGRPERRLLSPYATVTQPKPNSHSSSGHGSDNSSIISTEVHSQPSSKCDKVHGGGTSSGYESMLRESEETASSSSSSASSSRPHDSGSEQSDRKKGARHKGTKRSRSAPARASESPCSTGGGSQGSRVWVDPRGQGHKVKDDPLEVRRYEAEDVERLQRLRRQEEAEARGGSSDGDREVQTRQPGREELRDSRDHIVLHQQEGSGWGLDCKLLFCFCRSRPVKGTQV
ncbi:hypothetical protein ACOMHN_050984 [Nucella lapillus]